MEIMERFEYKVKNGCPGYKEDKMLNKLGSEGWELVSVCTNNSTHGTHDFYYYFKRLLCVGK